MTSLSLSVTFSKVFSQWLQCWGLLQESLYKSVDVIWVVHCNSVKYILCGIDSKDVCFWVRILCIELMYSIAVSSPVHAIWKFFALRAFVHYIGLLQCCYSLRRLLELFLKILWTHRWNIWRVLYIVGGSIFDLSKIRKSYNDRLDYNSIQFRLLVIKKKECPSWHSHNLEPERIWRSKKEQGYD